MVAPKWPQKRQEGAEGAVLLWTQRTVAAAVAAMVAVNGALTYVERASAAPPVPVTAADRSEPNASTVDPGDPRSGATEGRRTSGDVAWTASGNRPGCTCWWPEASIGYSWRTAATLSEPGFDTDRWDSAPWEAPALWP
jgi:hypothetical protein